MAVSNRIGPFTVLRPLGAGGMAETFVAERRGPGEFVQRVCLKRIRSDLAHDAELVRQFMAEAAIAARLRNASIAQVLDFGEDAGQLYLAMELIDGLDLRDLLKQHRSGLPATLVQHIAIELCTALDVAHSAPTGAVVHRDVSPSNVLVSTEGEVKLADFGIARSMETPSHTRTGIVRGKVPYMAPEYARTGRYDARADLFSLGVLLYECACGRRPHDGMTDLETLERATRGERIGLLEREAALPAGLASVIEQLLEAAPELRFSSASDVLDALVALPGDPRARRELGALVNAGRCAEATPTPAQVEESVALDSVSPHATTHLAPSPTAALQTRTRDSASLALPKHRSGPRLAIALALLAMVVAIGLAVSRASDRANGAAAPPAPPSAASSPASARENAASPAARPVAESSPPSVASRAREVILRPLGATTEDRTIGSGSPASSRALPDQRARLEVVVMPYGEVFVDDVHVGKSPLTVQLAPGTHAVRAHTPNGVLRRQISVRNGQRERLVLQ